MPTFIDMSALTKRTTLTGNEEFQVSATEKVTAQQIADLASTGIQIVTVTNFKTNIWNDTSGSNIFSSVPVGGMVVFKSATNATSGPGEALIGYAIKISSLMASYVGMTQSNGVSMIPALYTNKSSSVYDTKWQKLPDDSNVIKPIEVSDFTTIGESLPADLTLGMAIPFVTSGDVNNKPSGTDTSYTGIMVVTNTQQPIVKVMAWGDNSGACFWGVIDVSATTVTWNNNRLSVAKGTLSAFTETAITSYFHGISDGDLMPFLTPQSTKTTANQFPANGAWSGFITIGDNGGLNIIAFKSTTAANPEVYVGRCSGSTTQWTAVGGGGAVPSGGLAPGTVIFNGEFSFDGYTNANPGQLPLLQPIPLGSIVTFIGSYYFGPPAEEILLSPESHTWSLTVALPTGASSIAHYLKDMLVVQNPDTNLVVARQSAIYKIDAKNLVNGKISTIDMYAIGALLSDMYLTIDQIIYVAQV